MFFESSTVEDPNFVELVCTYSGTGPWLFQTEQEGQMYHSGIHALSAFYSLSLQALLSLGYIFYHFHCAELLMVHSDNSKEIK